MTVFDNDLRFDELLNEHVAAQDDIFRGYLGGKARNTSGINVNTGDSTPLSLGTSTQPVHSWDSCHRAGTHYWQTDTIELC